MKAQKRTSRTGFTLMVGLSCLAASHSGLTAESPDRILTTGAAVRSLSAQEAERRHPVKVRGGVEKHRRFIREMRVRLVDPASQQMHGISNS
jgi:hypothetical protein